MSGDLEDARLDHLNDLLRLGEMSQAEVDYLDKAGELDDPDTDDIDCDTDEHPGG